MIAKTLFWAKSDAGGKPHSLIAHCLDTAAVANILWSDFLSDHLKEELNRISNNRGRDLLVLICGWHDVGKATPAFQAKKIALEQPELVSSVRESLWLPTITRMGFEKWFHGKAGSCIARKAIERRGLAGWDWVFPIIEGHHGFFGKVPKKVPRSFSEAHGNSDWQEQQQLLADLIAQRCGINLDEWQLSFPSRGVQLAVAGMVSMADWIASSDLFPGVGVIDMSFEKASERAKNAWQKLAFQPGFDKQTLMSDPRQFVDRFSFEPRPLQQSMMLAASKMAEPGLLMVEAPMGEGKTEGALAAAEILARRFGCSGLMFCMPTQGTTDAMFDRVSDWAQVVDNRLVVSLLHGKSMLNEKWVSMTEGISIEGVYDENDKGELDEYGLPFNTGIASSTGSKTTSVPASWLLGRYRALLSPLAVGTIDQVLWAATRTKFVSLRHAGLAGKVLIIDEVHAYDAYMSVFLYELLRWAARLGIPVILMSATLPPKLRQALVAAWRSGKSKDITEGSLDENSYPLVIARCNDYPEIVETPASYGADREVKVEVLGASLDDTSAIARRAVSEVTNGGCALVIVNTVDRAQETWQAVAETGTPCILIHGRLTAAERARRTKEALLALGHQSRAEQMVVVATQIAEQSFDADADILFSDVAPMDLLLQRIGRLHRHVKPDQRPSTLARPRVIVTGLSLPGSDLPSWPKSFEYIYGCSTLFATSALIDKAPLWSIPSDIPGLVQAAYSDEWIGPPQWQDSWLAARAKENEDRIEREGRAKTFRLDADSENEPLTLDGLHEGASSAREESQAVVRDIEDDTVEVGLIVYDGQQFKTLSGKPLGPEATRAVRPEIAREIMGDSVRLSWRREMAEVKPLPQWAAHPILSRWPVVILNANLAGSLGKWSRYDSEIGLTSS